MSKPYCFLGLRGSGLERFHCITATNNNETKDNKLYIVLSVK